ncbi:MAG: hypothetical protein ABR953_05100 [Candidatus Acidiferrales bacterium]|jgi:hypothetical protein
MRKLIPAGSLVALLLPAVAVAQSNLDGTWKVDMKTAQFPTKPDVFVLQNGMYTCKTCVPPIEVKADGEGHKVTGHPYFDSVRIKILDDNTIEETDKKAGKTVTVAKTTVSAGGKTATTEFTDSSNTNAAPITGKAVVIRVAAGPAGSHAISGSWRVSKVNDISDNAIMVTFKVEGDGLHMSAPTGQSYTAKLDGTEAPYKGDPGVTTVSVKRIDANTVEETDKRDGKPISVTRMTVSADGKTVTFSSHDLLTGTTSKFVAMKQ